MEKKKKSRIEKDSLHQTTDLMTDFAEFGLNISEVTLITFLLEILHITKTQRLLLSKFLTDR